jgi:hypothetical protein
VNTPATLSVTWYENGVLVDPGVVTVKIDRADGTNLVAAGTATSGAGANPRTYTLTIGQNNLLDLLIATWTSATKGTITTRSEIVGGFLFTVAEARKVKPLDNTTTYPTADIESARTLVETALEDACGVAFVPRYRRDVLNGTGRGCVVLSRQRLRAVRAATIDGFAVTLSSVKIASSNSLMFSTLWSDSVEDVRWTRGYANVIVGYEHGHDYAPPRVSQAALLLAKNWLIKGPLDDRTTSLSTEDGTFTLATPGLRGSRFGIPEVDAVVDQYSIRSNVASVPLGTLLG